MSEISIMPGCLGQGVWREGQSGLTISLQGRHGGERIALGGAAGRRLASQLAMPVSGDTILRLVRRMPEPDLPTPAVIGVDDWAMRKRLRYGTIIVDLERHRPIDLLPGRTAGPVIDWLHQRPGIKVVARDRSTEYRRAITTGAPNAVQVADRWHLLYNLG